MPLDTVTEEQLIQKYGSVACLDEVGRGCLAGPVCVGAVLVTPETGPPPPGLADSKQLTARRREALLPTIHDWVPSYAVGSASSQEVDEVGIIAALRLAAVRAIASLAVRPGSVLLDGPYDYISAEDWEVPVSTLVKADAKCAGVAAASIIAKQHRDAVMVGLAQEHPQYGWEKNKGYGSQLHKEALKEHGVTEQHRKTWRLGV